MLPQEMGMLIREIKEFTQLMEEKLPMTMEHKDDVSGFYVSKLKKMFLTL